MFAGFGLKRVFMISKELLNILACPVCKTPVRVEGARLVCSSCNRRYPVKNGIPVMLAEEAEMPIREE